MIVSRPLAGSTEYGVCPITAAVGDLVYISGSKISNDYQVDVADPSDANKMLVVAIITAKPTTTRAALLFNGYTSAYTSLTPGATYWVGTDGHPTATPPSPAPAGTMRLQALGTAVDTNLLRFNPSTTAIVRVG